MDVVVRAGARLTSVRDPDLWWADDRMFDWVIPLGEALRPLDLSRRCTRVACPQRQFGSRPRRISVSEDLPRTGWLKFGVCQFYGFGRLPAM